MDVAIEVTAIINPCNSLQLFIVVATSVIFFCFVVVVAGVMAVSAVLLIIMGILVTMFFSKMVDSFIYKVLTNVQTNETQPFVIDVARVVRPLSELLSVDSYLEIMKSRALCNTQTELFFFTLGSRHFRSHVRACNLSVLATL